MTPDQRVYVAGTDTALGAAIVRKLRTSAFNDVIEDSPGYPDLLDQRSVTAFIRDVRAEYVFMCAGTIAGIGGNQRYPADLMLNNLLVTSHLIDAAYRGGVKKLLYIASSCMYPKHCPQPMRPDSLTSGPMEPTSEYYALAKLVGLKLCDAFRRQNGARFVTCIPSNPFGPGDHFDPENAHVIGALIHRFHEAKQNRNPAVSIWGSGNPRRDFIFIDDLADACVFVMKHYENETPINVGTGVDVSIREVATLVREVVGYEGALEFDVSQPDGFALKLVDVAPLRQLGWRPTTSLRAAIEATYGDYLSNVAGHQAGMASS